MNGIPMDEADSAEVPPGDQLIAEMFERPLTAEEFTELRSLAARDESVRGALRVAEAMLEERAARQSASGAEAGWLRFQAQLASAPRPLTAARHSARADRLRSLLSRAPIAFASLLLLETVAIGCMLFVPTAPSMRYRSADMGATCPPFVVRFKPDASERDLRRALLQAGASIASGPDERAFYRVTAPGVDLAHLHALLAPVIDSVDDNGACAASKDKP